MTTVASFSAGVIFGAVGYFRFAGGWEKVGVGVGGRGVLASASVGVLASASGKDDEGQKGNAGVSVV